MDPITLGRLAQDIESLLESPDRSTRARTLLDAACRHGAASAAALWTRHIDGAGAEAWSPVMSVGIAEALPGRDLVALVLAGELPRRLLVRGSLILPLIRGTDAALLLGESDETGTEDVELLLEVWAAVERSEASALPDDRQVDPWAGAMPRGRAESPRDRTGETRDEPEIP